MAVDSADEVGSHIDRVLVQILAILVERGSRQIIGLLLVGVQKQLDTVNSRITPVDLATPLEFGRVFLVVQDQSRNFGLLVAFETCCGSISQIFEFLPIDQGSTV